jgi:hypothetical protein
VVSGLRSRRCITAGRRTRAIVEKEQAVFDRSGILNVVIAIFAVIGLIAVLGIAGMAAVHVSMMHGMRFCSTATHVSRSVGSLIQGSLS